MDFFMTFAIDGINIHKDNWRATKMDFFNDI